MDDQILVAEVAGEAPPPPCHDQNVTLFSISLILYRRIAGVSISL